MEKHVPRRCSKDCRQPSYSLLATLRIFARSFPSASKGEDGSYTFPLPLSDVKIPWTILGDLGEFTACAFTKPELIGQRIGQASLLANDDHLAEIFSKATYRPSNTTRFPGKPLPVSVSQEPMNWPRCSGSGFSHWMTLPRHVTWTPSPRSWAGTSSQML
jgi:hypothetical protein